MSIANQHNLHNLFRYIESTSPQRALEISTYPPEVTSVQSISQLYPLSTSRSSTTEAPLVVSLHQWLNSPSTIDNHESFGSTLIAYAIRKQNLPITHQLAHLYYSQIPTVKKSTEFNLNVPKKNGPSLAQDTPKSAHLDALDVQYEPGPLVTLTEALFIINPHIFGPLLHNLQKSPELALNVFKAILPTSFPDQKEQFYSIPVLADLFPNSPFNTRPTNNNQLEQAPIDPFNLTTTQQPSHPPPPQTPAASQEAQIIDISHLHLPSSKHNITPYLIFNINFVSLDFPNSILYTFLNRKCPYSFDDLELATLFLQNGSRAYSIPPHHKHLAHPASRERHQKHEQVETGQNAHEHQSIGNISESSQNSSISNSKTQKYYKTYKAPTRIKRNVAQVLFSNVYQPYTPILSKLIITLYEYVPFDFKQGILLNPFTFLRIESELQRNKASARSSKHPNSSFLSRSSLEEDKSYENIGIDAHFSTLDDIYQQPIVVNPLYFLFSSLAHKYSLLHRSATGTLSTNLPQNDTNNDQQDDNQPQSSAPPPQYLVRSAPPLDWLQYIVAQCNLSITPLPYSSLSVKHPLRNESIQIDCSYHQPLLIIHSLLQLGVYDSNTYNIIQHIVESHFTELMWIHLDQIQSDALFSQVKFLHSCVFSAILPYVDPNVNRNCNPVQTRTNDDSDAAQVDIPKYTAPSSENPHHNVNSDTTTAATTPPFPLLHLLSCFFTLPVPNTTLPINQLQQLVPLLTTPGSQLARGNSEIGSHSTSSALLEEQLTHLLLKRPLRRICRRCSSSLSTPIMFRSPTPLFPSNPSDLTAPQILSRPPDLNSILTHPLIQRHDSNLSHGSNISTNAPSLSNSTNLSRNSPNLSRNPSHHFTKHAHHTNHDLLHSSHASFSAFLNSSASFTNPHPLAHPQMMQPTRGSEITPNEFPSELANLRTSSFTSSLTITNTSLPSDGLTFISTSAIAMTGVPMGDENTNNERDFRTVSNFNSPLGSRNLSNLNSNYNTAQNTPHQRHDQESFKPTPTPTNNDILASNDNPSSRRIAYNNIQNQVEQKDDHLAPFHNAQFDSVQNFPKHISPETFSPIYTPSSRHDDNNNHSKDNPDFTLHREAPTRILPRLIAADILQSQHDSSILTRQERNHDRLRRNTPQLFKLLHMYHSLANIHLLEANERMMQLNQRRKRIFNEQQRTTHGFALPSRPNSLNEAQDEDSEFNFQPDHNNIVQGDMCLHCGTINSEEPENAYNQYPEPPQQPHVFSSLFAYPLPSLSDHTNSQDCTTSNQNHSPICVRPFNDGLKNIITLLIQTTVLISRPSSIQQYVYLFNQLTADLIVVVAPSAHRVELVKFLLQPKKCQLPFPRLFPTPTDQPFSSQTAQYINTLKQHIPDELFDQLHIPTTVSIYNPAQIVINPILHPASPFSTQVLLPFLLFESNPTTFAHIIELLSDRGLDVLNTQYHNYLLALHQTGIKEYHVDATLNVPAIDWMIPQLFEFFNLQSILPLSMQPNIQRVEHIYRLFSLLMDLSRKKRTTASMNFPSYMEKYIDTPTVTFPFDFLAQIYEEFYEENEYLLSTLGSSNSTSGSPGHSTSLGPPLFNNTSAPEFMGVVHQHPHHPTPQDHKIASVPFHRLTSLQAYVDFNTSHFADIDGSSNSLPNRLFIPIDKIVSSWYIRRFVPFLQANDIDLSAFVNLPTNSIIIPSTAIILHKQHLEQLLQHHMFLYFVFSFRHRPTLHPGEDLGDRTAQSSASPHSPPNTPLKSSPSSHHATPTTQSLKLFHFLRDSCLLHSDYHSFVFAKFFGILDLHLNETISTQSPAKLAATSNSASKSNVNKPDQPNADGDDSNSFYLNDISVEFFKLTIRSWLCSYKCCLIINETTKESQQDDGSGDNEEVTIDMNITSAASALLTSTAVHTNLTSPVCATGDKRVVNIVQSMQSMDLQTNSPPNLPPKPSLLLLHDLFIEHDLMLFKTSSISLQAIISAIEHCAPYYLSDNHVLHLITIFELLYDACLLRKDFGKLAPATMSLTLLLDRCVEINHNVLRLINICTSFCPPQAVSIQRDRALRIEPNHPQSPPHRPNSPGCGLVNSKSMSNVYTSKIQFYSIDFHLKQQIPAAFALLYYVPTTTLPNIDSAHSPPSQNSPAFIASSPITTRHVSIHSPSPQPFLKRVDFTAWSSLLHLFLHEQNPKGDSTYLRIRYRFNINNNSLLYAAYSTLPWLNPLRIFLTSVLIQFQTLLQPIDNAFAHKCARLTSFDDQEALSVNTNQLCDSDISFASLTLISSAFIPLVKYLLFPTTTAVPPSLRTDPKYAHQYQLPFERLNTTATSSPTSTVRSLGGVSPVSAHVGSPIAPHSKSISTPASQTQFKTDGPKSHPTTQIQTKVTSARSQIHHPLTSESDYDIIDDHDFVGHERPIAPAKPHSDAKPKPQTQGHQQSTTIYLNTSLPSSPKQTTNSTQNAALNATSAQTHPSPIREDDSESDTEFADAVPFFGIGSFFLPSPPKKTKARTKSSSKKKPVVNVNIPAYPAIHWDLGMYKDIPMPMMYHLFTHKDSIAVNPASMSQPSAHSNLVKLFNVSTEVLSDPALQHNMVQIASQTHHVYLKNRPRYLIESLCVATDLHAYLKSILAKLDQQHSVHSYISQNFNLIAEVVNIIRYELGIYLDPSSHESYDVSMEQAGYSPPSSTRSISASTSSAQSVVQTGCTDPFRSRFSLTPTNAPSQLQISPEIDLHIQKHLIEQKFTHLLPVAVRAAVNPLLSSKFHQFLVRSPFLSPSLIFSIFMKTLCNLPTLAHPYCPCNLCARVYLGQAKSDLPKPVTTNHLSIVNSLLECGADLLSLPYLDYIEAIATFSDVLFAFPIALRSAGPNNLGSFSQSSQNFPLSPSQRTPSSMSLFSHSASNTTANNPTIPPISETAMSSRQPSLSNLSLVAPSTTDQPSRAFLAQLQTLPPTSRSPRHTAFTLALITHHLQSHNVVIEFIRTTPFWTTERYKLLLQLLSICSITYTPLTYILYSLLQSSISDGLERRVIYYPATTSPAATTTSDAQPFTQSSDLLTTTLNYFKFQNKYEIYGLHGFLALPSLSLDQDPVLQHDSVQSYRNLNFSPRPTQYPTIKPTASMSPSTLESAPSLTRSPTPLAMRSLTKAQSLSLTKPPQLPLQFSPNKSSVPQQPPTLPTPPPRTPPHDTKLIARVQHTLYFYLKGRFEYDFSKSPQLLQRQISSLTILPPCTNFQTVMQALCNHPSYIVRNALFGRPNIVTTQSLIAPAQPVVSQPQQKSGFFSFASKVQPKPQPAAPQYKTTSTIQSPLVSPPPAEAVPLMSNYQPLFNNKLFNNKSATPVPASTNAPNTTYTHLSSPQQLFNAQGVSQVQYFHNPIAEINSLQRSFGALSVQRFFSLHYSTVGPTGPFTPVNCATFQQTQNPVVCELIQGIHPTTNPQSPSLPDQSRPPSSQPLQSQAATPNSEVGSFSSARRPSFITPFSPNSQMLPAAPHPRQQRPEQMPGVLPGSQSAEKDNQSVTSQTVSVFSALDTALDTPYQLLLISDPGNAGILQYVLNTVHQPALKDISELCLKTSCFNIPAASQLVIILLAILRRLDEEVIIYFVQQMSIEVLFSTTENILSTHVPNSSHTNNQPTHDSTLSSKPSLHGDQPIAQATQSLPCCIVLDFLYGCDLLDEYDELAEMLLDQYETQYQLEYQPPTI